MRAARLQTFRAELSVIRQALDGQNVVVELFLHDLAGCPLYRDVVPRYVRSAQRWARTRFIAPGSV